MSSSSTSTPGSMGVKAIAIYRDNCKVAQPLSTGSKDSSTDDSSSESAAAADAPIEPHVETKIVYKPVRERLPRDRRSRTFEFRVADCKGYINIGEYDDGPARRGVPPGVETGLDPGRDHGRPGDLAQPRSPIWVPLRKYVETYTGMRFEPAGMTDDPDIRIASSIMDYLFRKLAVVYLSYEERASLGIFTTGERTQQTLPGVDDTTSTLGSDVPADPPSSSRPTISWPAFQRRSPSQHRLPIPTLRSACSAGSRCSGRGAVTPAPGAATPVVVHKEVRR